MKKELFKKTKQMSDDRRRKNISYSFYILHEGALLESGSV